MKSEGPDYTSVWIIVLLPKQRNNIATTIFFCKYYEFVLFVQMLVQHLMVKKPTDF
jgi:hypothetical protein